MTRDQDDLSSADSAPEVERSPRVMFLRIRETFSELGLLGRTLSVELEGICYRVSCDEKAFMVYRVNSITGPRHHVPGWPVCLVSPDMIFEECCAPGLGADHYSCGLDIDKWLEVIHSRCRATGDY